MSIYVLIDYKDHCDTLGINLTWRGLQEYKKKYWRD